MTGGSYSRDQKSSFESHLTANGTEDSSGTITGNFTFNGSSGNSLTFNDSGGDAASSGLNYTLNYTASDDQTLSGSGNLVPDGSNQGTIEIDSSATGDMTLTDAGNGFLGVSLDDGDNVKSTYSGGKPSTPPSPPTTGPIDPNGPTTKIAVPDGKHVVNVIDKGDRGWFSWSQAQRDQYAQEHGIDPNKTPSGNVANGSDFLAGIAPPNGSFVYGYGVDQIVGDLGAVTGQFGQIDVLVVTDHGGPGYQQIGNQNLIPSKPNPASPTSLDKLVGFIKKPGGTLIIAGCSVFGDQPSIDAWQAYATATGITIMGSTSPVTYAPGDVQGVWITLAPGGTPPKVNFP